MFVFEENKPVCERVFAEWLAARPTSKAVTAGGP
jgi:hypothetical protein